jgi:hypothetical protein
MDLVRLALYLVILIATAFLTYRILGYLNVMLRKKAPLPAVAKVAVVRSPAESAFTVVTSADSVSLARSIDRALYSIKAEDVARAIDALQKDPVMRQPLVTSASSSP